MKAQVVFVSDGLRPGFQLLVGIQIMPCVPSLLVKQPPSGIVCSSVIAVHQVSICMPIRVTVKVPIGTLVGRFVT